MSMKPTHVASSSGTQAAISPLDADSLRLLNVICQRFRQRVERIMRESRSGKVAMQVAVDLGAIKRGRGDDGTWIQPERETPD